MHLDGTGDTDRHAKDKYSFIKEDADGYVHAYLSRKGGSRMRWNCHGRYSTVLEQEGEMGNTKLILDDPLSVLCVAGRHDSNRW